jgi:hypothetical protein|nr:MAG TPA: hypothetical protein [Caudoviricetes sp.]
MASKTQKVITPENLGQGIAYNPQTKKWEVHFVSEAEIEQVTNYVEPQEDDEHYVEREDIKLRDRTSGFMWDSYKSVLKDRAPARDEILRTPLSVNLARDALSLNFEVSNTSNHSAHDDQQISLQDDPENQATFNLENYDNVTTEEFNRTLAGKKIKYTTNARFSNMEGKPKIRETTFEVAYPVVDEITDTLTYSYSSTHSLLKAAEGDRYHIPLKKLVEAGKLQLEVIAEADNAERQTAIINASNVDVLDSNFDFASKLAERYIIRRSGQPVNEELDIALTTNKLHLMIKFTPNEVIFNRPGQKITCNFQNFDNGIQVENVRKPAPKNPEGISNVRWRENFLADENYHRYGDNVFPTLLYHSDALNTDSDKTLNSAALADAKEANDHYKDLGVEVDHDGKTVTIPWIDLPYIDTAVSFGPLKRGNRGANDGAWNVLAPEFAPGISDDEKQAINKALKEEARSINVNVKVIDKETGADVMSFTQTPATYRASNNFLLDGSFRTYIKGGHPAVKLTVSADPITIKWWSGKVVLNFKPYDVYFKENSTLGSFEA